MKISFHKITSVPKDCYYKKDGVCLECKIVRRTSKIVELFGIMRGRFDLVCDLSGEEFTKEICEELTLFISDGIWDKQSQFDLNDFAVIEFFDGFIDIDLILSSEIESIKLDYHSKEDPNLIKE